MPASVRETDIASMLEDFLDTNEEDLPPRMFQVLNELAGDIDKRAMELNETVETLQYENKELSETIKELEE